MPILEHVECTEKGYGAARKLRIFFFDERSASALRSFVLMRSNSILTYSQGSRTVADADDRLLQQHTTTTLALPRAADTADNNRPYKMLSSFVSRETSIQTITKRVAFEGLNSDEEQDRTARGLRSRKERKAVKQRRKMADGDKKKQKDRKNQEHMTSTYNKLIDEEEEYRFINAFNDSAALVEAPEHEEQNDEADRFEEARVAANKYLSRWKSMMNAFQVKCEDTAKATIANFREKYMNEEMKNLSAKKKATLKDFALCGVTKSYLGVFRSEDDTTSGDDSHVSFDHWNVGKIFRERFPVAGPVAFAHVKQSQMLAFGSSSHDTTDQQTTGAEKDIGVSAAADVLNAVPRQQAEDAKPAADPDNDGGKSGGSGRRIAQSQDSHGDGNTKKQRTKN